MLYKDSLPGYVIYISNQDPPKTQIKIFVDEAHWTSIWVKELFEVIKILLGIDIFNVFLFFI